jgi:hypothetical protein
MTDVDDRDICNGMIGAIINRARLDYENFRRRGYIRSDGSVRSGAIKCFINDSGAKRLITREDVVDVVDFFNDGGRAEQLLALLGSNVSASAIRRRLHK